MKLKITKRVHDKRTGDTLLEGTEIERPQRRAEQFLDAKVAVEIKEEKPELKAEPEATSEAEPKPKKKRKSKKKE